MKTILVTGGAGFIGSNFIQYMLKAHPTYKIINLDALTYAGNLENLKEVENNSNYEFIQENITNQNKINEIVKKHQPNIVVNFAAESHNDRAVLDPLIFLRTNVLGTQSLLEAAKTNNVKRFHHISTCEVFGDLALNSKKSFKETSPYKPRTPYNASKAAANHVV